ncbi:MAG: hypothetical protein LBC61_04570 [Candidatus Peribacteria bacterium]|nr:hypothetical protein [Candidatus Peribacteria bacterium]
MLKIELQIARTTTADTIVMVTFVSENCSAFDRNLDKINKSHKNATIINNELKKPNIVLINHANICIANTAIIGK